MATTGGGENLGAARIDITLDTTELELGIERAKSRMAGMSASAQTEYNKLNVTEKRRIDSLKRQADRIGLTREQQIAYDITLRTSGKVQGDLLQTVVRNTQAIQAQGVAATKTGIQFNQYGLSAKQNAAALRQVPAQMTDIFVSLQGGQKPLTVLLQQGGQLKDVFGGVVPAAKALGSAVLRLVNPYTIAAAAIGTFAIAAYKGEQESNAYAKSLAFVGDQAGVNVSQLQAMAVAISTGNATQGKAAEALVLVAKSGKFVGDQFQNVAAAAVAMEQATGQALDVTIGKFAELAGDPVGAVAKLNAEQGFLTETVYQQIKALVEQGNTTAAASLAMEEYANATIRATDEVQENLGFLQTAWRNITIVAKEAWDAMASIGRDDTTSDIVTKLGGQLASLKAAPGATTGLGKTLIADKKAELQAAIRVQVSENRATYLAAAKQDAQNYAIAQDQNIAALKGADAKRAAEVKKSRGESERRALIEIEAGRPAVAALLRKNQVEYEAALQAQAKKPRAGRKGDGGIGRAESRAGLQDFKDALTEKQAALQADTKILAAEYAAKLVTQEEYFSKTRTLMLAGDAAQEEALTGQIAFLRAKSASGKEAIDIERQLGQLEAELAKTRLQAASEQKVLQIQQQAYEKARVNSLEDYSDALDLGTEALREQVRAQILSIGMGQREFELHQRLTAILREQAAEERRLAQAKRDGAISAPDYARMSADNARAAGERVRVEKDAYGQLEVAQQDWQSGMRAGLQDWVTQASDVAGQVRNITVGALDRIADGFAELAITGKLNYKAMLRDILSEIVKFMAKQIVLNFVKMFAGSFLNTTAATPNALGGVYGSPSLSQYSNSVVSQPTAFMFAKGGSFGVMGEAGDEAIMPLTRGADGNLGVRAQMGDGAAASVLINVNTTINSDGTASSSARSEGENAAAFKQFAEQMRTIANEQVQRAMRPGGQLWRAGVAA